MPSKMWPLKFAYFHLLLCFITHLVHADSKELTGFSKHSWPFHALSFLIVPVPPPGVPLSPPLWSLRSSTFIPSPLPLCRCLCSSQFPLPLCYFWDSSKLHFMHNNGWYIYLSPSLDPDFLKCEGGTLFICIFKILHSLMFNSSQWIFGKWMNGQVQNMETLF